MKKTILFNLLVVLFLVSCSSDNTNDELQKDELLSNTEWVYSYTEPIDKPTEETEYNNSTINKFLQYASYKFPSIVSSITVDYIDLKEEKSVINKVINEEKLKFHDNQCVYSNLKQNLISTQTVKNKYKRMTIPSQECTNEVGDVLKVLPNGIFITEKTADLPQEKRIIELGNNQYKEYASLIEVLSEKESTEIIENTSLSFYFKRADNEIIITNSSYTWIGTLDKNKWTISVEQINPERKNIREFRKK